jgi:hypothetical protein
MDCGLSLTIDVDHLYILRSGSNIVDVDLAERIPNPRVSGEAFVDPGVDAAAFDIDVVRLAIAVQTENDQSKLLPRCRRVPALLCEENRVAIATILPSRDRTLGRPVVDRLAISRFLQKGQDVAYVTDTGPVAVAVAV